MSAYARHARKVFQTFLDERPVTRPEPVSACTLCRWKTHCKAEWDRDDSLALVAGISRRMHPTVCSYISSAVYEGRLHPDEAAGTQTLTDAAGTSLVGAGVRPVIHTGRSQVSPEEIAAIKARIDAVLGATYRSRNGAERVIGHGDILVVAPYNAQVNALRAALPSAVRVGTVDRFQGQEAPVCLVSMTTSSGEELPRDIEFLFSLNRINVAVSRAQASAMVFASPLLLETPCRTVAEMALVNALCLLREHGGEAF
ncbi:DEAD/DEAH box helicase [Sphingomonas sp. BAUL-RG-20F-R05-02]|uniref:DEAD/DEAH box helicase n=1 Tax=Sphingomonas sp. BAUL-RG-20F-R05-02 TaxID=2914830 RepID=UPI001F59C5FA|nr:C-terminal helicase domain-containing protein [Sphingomonas sp. BAUL-RG-20F-R05-02]